VPVAATLRATCFRTATSICAAPTRVPKARNAHLVHDRFHDLSAIRPDDSLGDEALVGLEPDLLGRRMIGSDQQRRFGALSRSRDTSGAARARSGRSFWGAEDSATSQRAGQVDHPRPAQQIA